MIKNDNLLAVVSLRGVIFATGKLCDCPPFALDDFVTTISECNISISPARSSGAARDTDLVVNIKFINSSDDIHHAI